MGFETIILSVAGSIILIQTGVIGYFVRGKLKKIDDIEHNYITRLDKIRDDINIVKEQLNDFYTEHKVLTRGLEQCPTVHK